MPDEKRDPTFLVIGAGKSGTTTLCELLGQHPDVFITDPKEPHFFSADYDRGWEWYASFYRPARGEKERGEGSVSYTMEDYQPDVSERIARDLPDARLIYIVRHPLRRIESGWRHLLKTNRTDKDLSDTVEARPRLVSSSMYWRQISYYLDRFPHEQVQILFFEDFINDTQAELRKCWDFLKVDPDFAPEDMSPSNVSTGRWIWPISHILRGRSIPERLQPPDCMKDLVRTFLFSSFGSKEKSPQWRPEVWESVVAKIKPDAEKFLCYFEKPESFWDFSRSD